MQPATVLIYLPLRATESSGTSCLEPIAPALQKFLNDRGLKSRRVHGPDLVESLNSGERYDIVFMDLTEAGGLQNQIDASAARPVVVPVATRRMNAQVMAAKNRYASVVKDVTKAEQYLDAIEDAMRSRGR
jgi:DNA-binding NtrC family response regulator